MTTGPYAVEEVEDAGDASCSCSNCDWKGAASETQDIGDCALTPGDASPVGRCPECDCLAYLDQPLRPDAEKQTLGALINDLDAYLREIRAENLDGSEPALGELLERSLKVRTEMKI